MKKTLTLMLFLLAAFWGKLSAQNLNACSSLPPTGASFCGQSCIWCELDSTIDTNDDPLPGGGGGGFGLLCFTLENPKWYGFIAGSTSISLEIEPISCGGSGVQAAVFSGCNTLLACNEAGIIGPVGLNLTNLTIGAPYQLVVDGNNGSICTYRIKVTSGSAVGPPLGSIGNIQGLSQVCPGATVTYTIPPVANAVSYTWIAPPGAYLNGILNATQLTLPAATGTSVDVTFTTLGGNLCVRASNACSTPVQSCLQITNQPLPINDLPDLELCFESLPYQWPEEPFNNVFVPGTYTFVSTPYTSSLGCDSVVRQKVTILPRKLKNLPAAYLCDGECLTVGFNDFCDAGSYSEFLIADNGCDSTVNFTIIKLSVTAAGQVSDTIRCNNPSVILTSNGSSTGTGIFYKWVNPSGQTISTNPQLVTSTPGEYQLIVSRVGGGRFCYDTAIVVVAADLVNPIALAGPPLVLDCNQPEIILQGQGSEGEEYTYLWTASGGGNIVAGSNTLEPYVNAPGTYTLRVTNTDNGCISQSVTTVTQNNIAPTVSATGGTFNCVNPVTINAITNAVNPLYYWTAPDGFIYTTESPSVNQAGTYNLTVTDANNGCTASTSTVVLGDTLGPELTVSGGALTCTSNTVTLNAQADDATYAWEGPNGFNSNLQSPEVNEAGTYTVTATGPNGCFSVKSVTVDTDNSLPGANVVASGNLNCNADAINLIASGNVTSPLSYSWTAPDGSTTQTGSTPSLSVTEAGEYTVVVTSETNGCTSTATVTVINNPDVTAVIDGVQNVSCFGGTNGSLSVTPGGGTGTYTYEWNTTGTGAQVSNLVAGTYSVTVTDSENCTATATTVIDEPAVLEANTSATPQGSNGSTDGTATADPIGGTQPYTYAWSNDETTQTISSLAPGSYTVTVTDANGCTSIETATVNAYNCNIQADIQANDVSCFGAADGTAAAVVTNGIAPYTYAWSTGPSDQDQIVADLEPGTYTATVTDAANCPVVLTFVITEPNELQANATASNESGPNTNDGTASASPTGGSQPYTYAWSNDSTTVSITGLDQGTYTVTISDANGCSAIQEVEVGVDNCGLLTNFVVNNPLCVSTTTGEATILLTGGNPPFNYVWSSGGTAETETGLAEGDYTVSVTDANGCQITESISLTDPDPLTLAIETIINTECENIPTGFASVAGAGGTGTLSYEWSSGQTGTSAEGLIAGDYTVVVTDANGCTAEQSLTIQAIDVVPPVIAAAPIDLPLGPAGTITVNLQTMNAFVSDNCAVSTVTFSPTSFNCGELGEHEVTITATDASGNTSVQVVVITVVDNSAPTLVCPASIIRCAGDNVVQYPAPSATDNCFGNGGTFSLDSGLPSGSEFPDGVTTVTYTYTDADGNAGSCSFEVNILAPVVVNNFNVINDIDNQNIGAIDLSVSGGLSPYSFQWEFDGTALPDTTEDIANIGAGSYVVTITDSEGCTGVSQVIQVSNTIDADEPDALGKLRVYPNPTSGRITVDFGQEIVGDIQFMVFDMTGRQVRIQHERDRAQINLEMGDLPDGMYTLHLRVAKQQMVKKIVVSH